LIAFLIIIKGADPNLHNEDDPQKRTPFLVSANKGHYDIVKTLLEYGADPQIVTQVCCSLFQV
jgi:ankyrin repeat protein